jgi:hypothetical protein
MAASPQSFLHAQQISTLGINFRAILFALSLGMEFEEALHAEFAPETTLIVDLAEDNSSSFTSNPPSISFSIVEPL